MSLTSPRSAGTRESHPDRTAPSNWNRSAALDRLARIYDEPLPTAIDPVLALALARHAQARAADGYVFEDAALTAAADALGRAGVPAGSRILRGLVSAPGSGVCAAVTPQ
jgi:hypothetical protein